MYAGVLFSSIYTEWIQGIRVSQTVPVMAETIPKRERSINSGHIQ